MSERTTAELLIKAGGKRIQRGAGDSWDFGWQRTDEAGWERLYQSGVFRDHDPGEDVPEIKGPRVDLTAAVKAAFGAYCFAWQMIGSCVQCGGQNGAIVRLSNEAIYAPKHEGIELPFTWIAYAASRGNVSPGDGSSGTEFAARLADIGIPSNKTPGLPQPKLIPIKNRKDAFAIVYSPGSLEEIGRFDPQRMSPRIVAEYELQFSTMRNIKQEWLDAAKKHKMQFVRCRSAAEVQTELRRRRPILAAGDWGGLTKCPMTGTPGILLNRHASSWSHQQSINQFWEHPTLGDVYRWQNQWYMLDGNEAVSLHGECPPDEPPGGYWTKPVDVDYQARTGEVFALHGFEGYTDADIDWTKGA